MVTSNKFIPKLLAVGRDTINVPRDPDGDRYGYCAAWFSNQPIDASVCSNLFLFQGMNYIGGLGPGLYDLRPCLTAPNSHVDMLFFTGESIIPEANGSSVCYNIQLWFSRPGTAVPEGFLVADQGDYGTIDPFVYPPNIDAIFADLEARGAASAMLGIVFEPCGISPAGADTGFLFDNSAVETTTYGLATGIFLRDWAFGVQSSFSPAVASLGCNDLNTQPPAPTDPPSPFTFIDGNYYFKYSLSCGEVYTHLAIIPAGIGTNKFFGGIKAWNTPPDLDIWSKHPVRVNHGTPDNPDWKWHPVKRFDGATGLWKRNV